LKRSFHKYKRRDVLKLLSIALFEPFFYPVHTYFAVRPTSSNERKKRGVPSAMADKKKKSRRKSGGDNDF
jgi:hypothetical protein